ncbi:MAG: lysophospholipid acyltransferase family protein [Roseburia sp.]
MIRTIFVLLFVLLYLILGIPVLGVEWIIRKFNRRVADLSSLRMVQWAFRVILFLCGTKLTVLGEEHVPKDQPVLYIGNHRSYFDVIITYSRCPGLTGYIAKDNMTKVPLLSTWMKRLYCLFLNREDMRKGLKTILMAIDQIKAGISICIFPEGTRNRTEEEMLPFHAGSFKIAEKTDCPIIPMAITNSADILEAHFPFIHKTHVILQYGEPILVSELSAEDKKHLSDYAQNQIHLMLAENEKYR